MTTESKGGEGDAVRNPLKGITLDSIRRIEEDYDLDVEWEDGLWEVTLRAPGAPRTVAVACHQSIAIAQAAVALAVAILADAGRGE